MLLLFLSAVHFALSAHTLGVQLSVYSVGACSRSKSGPVKPIRDLALRGKPVIVIISGV